MSACIFSKYRNIFGVKIPLVLTTIGWFLLGIFFHIIFGVQTDVIKKLGIKC